MTGTAASPEPSPREPENSQWRYHLGLMLNSRQDEGVASGMRGLSQAMGGMTPPEELFVAGELLEKCTMELTPAARNHLSLRIGQQAAASNEFRERVERHLSEHAGIEWCGYCEGLFSSRRHTVPEGGSEHYGNALYEAIIQGDSEYLEDACSSVLVFLLGTTTQQPIELLHELQSDERLGGAIDERLSALPDLEMRFLQQLKGTIAGEALRSGLSRLAAARVERIQARAELLAPELREFFEQHQRSPAQAVVDAFLEEGADLVFLAEPFWRPEESDRLVRELLSICEEASVTHLFVQGLPIGASLDDIDIRAQAIAPDGSALQELLLFPDDEEEVMLRAIEQFYQQLSPVVQVKGIDCPASIYTKNFGELQRDQQVAALQEVLEDPSSRVLVLSDQELAFAPKRESLGQVLPSHLGVRQKVRRVLTRHIEDLDRDLIGKFFSQYPPSQSVGVPTTVAPLAEIEHAELKAPYGAVADYFIFRVKGDPGPERERQETPTPGTSVPSSPLLTV
ncbi:hypothetical protein MRY87_03180 [bacterium]|nr:hypothetical protein [bacterium]